MEVLRQTLRYLDEKRNDVYFLRRFYRNSDGRLLYNKNILAKRSVPPDNDPCGNDPEEIEEGFSQIRNGAIIPIETYEAFLKTYELAKSYPESLESLMGILASLTFRGDSGIEVNLASDKLTIVRSGLLRKVYENTLLIDIESDIKIPRNDIPKILVRT